MREDLPFEEPLPDLWSISLAVGGDLVGGGPRLEDFHVLQSLQLELGKSRRRYWRVESVDGRNSSSSSNQHVLNVLCEHRWVVGTRLRALLWLRNCEGVQPPPCLVCVRFNGVRLHMNVFCCMKYRSIIVLLAMYSTSNDLLVVLRSSIVELIVLCAVVLI